MIFGGKVGLENGRDKNLLKQAILAICKSDGLIADVKALTWSEQPITFSRADMSAKILDAGRFPLVLDPVIGNVRFEKVLINGGSALNILFVQALAELGLKQEDLTPYDSPF